MFYYSITTKGFYNSENLEQYQEAGTLPADLVEISDSEYDAYWNPPEGFYQLFDETGPHLEMIDQVMVATQKREQLLAEIQSATYTLNMKLNLGRTLTDEEKAVLSSWLDYADALNALDLSTAPNITWPEKPN